MRVVRCAGVAAIGVGLGGFGTSASADPWADEVVGYTQGTGAASGFTDPVSALGSPTRITSPASPFGGPTTPFQGAFGADELVSIGEGGQLTVRFDNVVRNDPGNPFGIDLLVFGNAFYFDAAFPDGVAGAFAGEGGVIEVSNDGVTWTLVPGAGADSGFPTLGFNDITEPFPTVAGIDPTDFTRPVDPGFNPSGLGLADIIAGYDGSGGGLGIDIGALGLDQIRFVRVTNPIGSGFTPEIDAFADVVPGPGGGSVVAAIVLLGARRRRSDR
jgi:hypothetical protein